MDRRTALGTLGFASAAGLIGREAQAQDHPAADPAHRFMAPVQKVHAHFCGIHVAKNNPRFQLMAQHFCAPHGEEMHQCLLFDSCETNAKLLGVEYIVSDRIYRGLPDDEKKYWHPHTYEVLAGGLIAPSMTAENEMKFMKAILTTWGKTWHTWPDPATPVPIGAPLLMWALTGDGQIDETVLAKRDREFHVNSDQIRATRRDAIRYEVPQIPQPDSIDVIGRQWTASGDDKPKPIR
jgi:hypothetical protein